MFRIIMKIVPIQNQRTSISKFLLANKIKPKDPAYY